MKATINISDTAMREIEREAARRRQTVSEVVEAALRNLIERERQAVELPPLPEFSSGGLKVDVANRDVLYDVMEH